MTIFTITKFCQYKSTFSIKYFDIVLLFISHHQLQINDGRTDIQVCRHYNFRRVDDGHRMMRKGHITSYGHLEKKIV